MKEFQKFYKTARWKAAREHVLKRDMYLCQHCLREGKIVPGNTVHHIRELTPLTVEVPEIAIGEENLITLCRDCHARVHGDRPDTRYKLDDFGQVVFEDSTAG